MFTKIYSSFEQRLKLSKTKKYILFKIVLLPSSSFRNRFGHFEATSTESGMRDRWYWRRLMRQAVASLLILCSNLRMMWWQGRGCAGTWRASTRGATARGASTIILLLFLLFLQESLLLCSLPCSSELSLFLQQIMLHIKLCCFEVQNRALNGDSKTEQELRFCTLLLFPAAF